MKIEENFSKIYYPESSNDNINNDIAILQNKNDEDDKENEEILKKIKEYQIKTKELQKQIELIVKLNKIDELEGDLEIKKNYLNQLKSENNSLQNIKLMQDKGLNEYKKNAAKRQELLSIIEKTKKIKEEIKIKKDYLKLTDDKLKGQINKIRELERNCHTIRDNIEIAKRKKEEEGKQEEQKKILEKEKEEINKYEEDNKLLHEKEKNCKIIIKEQNGIISKLKSEVNIINKDVKETDKKIKDIQTKITIIQNKIRKKKFEQNRDAKVNLNGAYNSSQRNINNNINNMNYQLKIKKLMNDELGKNFLAQKDEKFLFNNNNSNLNIQSDVIKIRKIKKPFENYINFNGNKNNKEENNIYNINDNKNKESEKAKKQEFMEKNETVCKIKQLKSDIEETLSKNVININNRQNNDNDNTNENNNSSNPQKIIEDNKNIHEKINEEVYEEKIKDVIPENKFTNYYEYNE